MIGFVHGCRCLFPSFEMVLAPTKFEDCTGDKEFEDDFGATAVAPTLDFLCETSMAGINDVINRSMFIVDERIMCIY